MLKKINLMFLSSIVLFSLMSIDIVLAGCVTITVQYVDGYPRSNAFVQWSNNTDWHFFGSTDETGTKILCNHLAPGFYTISAWYPDLATQFGVNRTLEVNATGDGSKTIINESLLDTDLDGIGDCQDNCWYVPNFNQLDSNGNCPLPPYHSDPKCGDACEITTTTTSTSTSTSTSTISTTTTATSTSTSTSTTTSTSTSTTSTLTSTSTTSTSTTMITTTTTVPEECRCSRWWNTFICCEEGNRWFEWGRDLNTWFIRRCYPRGCDEEIVCESSWANVCFGPRYWTVEISSLKPNE